MIKVWPFYVRNSTSLVEKFLQFGKDAFLFLRKMQGNNKYSILGLILNLIVFQKII